MRPEEYFSLEWLGTSSILLATNIDEIHRVYVKKVAEREAAKGNAKIIEEEVHAPPQRPVKAFTKEMRMAQAFSCFEAKFVDLNPQAGLSTRAQSQPSSLVREVGEDINREIVDRMIKAVISTVVAEAK